MTVLNLFKKFRLLIGTFYKQDSQLLFSLLPRYLWAIFICMIYRFVFQAALSGKSVHVDQYALPFPIFLISGIASVRLLVFSLRIFEDTIANIRKSVPLAELLMTPTSLWEIMLAHTAWKGFLAINELIAVLISSKILLNIPLSPFFLFPVVVSGALTVLSYAGIGMTISAANLFIKKADPIFTILNQISTAFCGVFFPIALFPSVIKLLALSLPLTHGLNIVRLSLAGASLDKIAPSIIGFTVITAFFMLTGIVLLQRSLVWAKKNGKL